jgi:hypothetical protein
LDSLKALKDRGYKVGIWTNKNRSKVPVEKLQALVGFEFDVILSGEHSMKPSYRYRLENQLGEHDKVKQIGLYFRLKNVVLVDDTPGKVTPEERDQLVHIKTWDDKNDDDQELSDTVTKILSVEGSLVFSELPFGSVSDPVREYDFSTMSTFLGPDGSERRSIVPIEFHGSDRLTIIRAGMGCGKSQRCIDYIKKHNPKRVLILTARVQQAYTSLGRYNKSGLGFQLYKDVTNLAATDRLICQFESLHRLMDSGVFESYDLVIIDEVRGLAQQTVWTDNKNLVMNNKIFEMILASCPFHIWLDAHVEVDGMIFDMAQQYFLDQWMLHRYRYTSLQREFTFQHNRLIAIGDLIERMKRKELVMCCFGSKRELEAVTMFVGEMVPDVNMLIFKSQQDCDHITKFADIDVHLAGVNLLAFTSVVTTGADIQTAVSKVICFGTSTGCSYRDMMQMNGRARNVLDPEVVVCPPGNGIVPGEKETPSIHSILRQLENNQSGRKQYVRTMAALNPELQFDGTRVTWAPGHLLRRYAWKEREERTDFETGFGALSRHSGYLTKLSEEPSDAAAEEALKEHLTRTIHTIAFQDAVDRNEGVDTMLRMCGMSRDARNRYLEGLQTKIERSVATADDYHLHNVTTSVKYIQPEYIAGLGSKELEILSNPTDRSQMLASSLLTIYLRDSTLPIHMDIPGLSNGLGDFVKIRSKHVKHVSSAIMAFGFNRDLTNSVMSDTLTPVIFRDVLSNCDDAQKARGGRSQSKSQSIDKKRTVMALQRELRSCGRMLKKQKKGDGRREYSIHHLVRTCKKKYDPNSGEYEGEEEVDYGDLLKKLIPLSSECFSKEGEGDEKAGDEEAGDEEAGAREDEDKNDAEEVKACEEFAKQF